MERLLEKLNVLSAKWEKAYKQVNQKDSGKPMCWTIDSFGTLHLDGIWVCPARYLDENKLSDCHVNDVTISLPLLDGYCDIIIITEFGKATVCAIERRPKDN